MRARPIRVYLDSNVLIAYVADEEGRAGVVQSVLEDAREERIDLITSVLSITEVAYISSGQAGGDPVGSQDAIDQLWVPASPITVVDVSARVALEARAIIRQSKTLGTRVVKPADAIHLASASIQQCDRLFTYESESTRGKWEDLVHVRVAEPFLDEPRLDIGEA